MVEFGYIVRCAFSDLFCNIQNYILLDSREFEHIACNLNPQKKLLVMFPSRCRDAAIINPIRISDILAIIRSASSFTMTYEQNIITAINSQKGWMSRPAIKTYLTANCGFVDTAVNKVHLKKALAKFEKKGDSYKVKKTQRKSNVNKEKIAARKAKAAAKKLALKEKKLAKKAAVAAKKQAAKEKKLAKKAAVAAKKKAAAEKKASKKAAAKAKKAASKAKKASKKKSVKKAVKKVAKKVSKKVVKKSKK